MQGAGGLDRHHLVGGPGRLGAHAVTSVACTVSRSHCSKVERSRLIASHSLVGVVVADGVARGVGGGRAAGHLGHGGHRPAGQHDRAVRRGELVHDLLDGDDRAAGGQHGLLLHAGDAPDRATLPARSACCAWMTVTSGLSAGTAVRVSPVNGHSMVRIVSVTVSQVGADVAAQHRERQPAGAGDVAGRHPGVAVLLDLQRHRPAGLDRVTEAVQRADTGVATPAEDRACGRTRRRSSGRRRRRASSAPGSGRGGPGG